MAHLGLLLLFIMRVLPSFARWGISATGESGDLLVSSVYICWDLVAHPVTQVIGEQALVDILDLSEVAMLSEERLCSWEVSGNYL